MRTLLRLFAGAVNRYDRWVTEMDRRTPLPSRRWCDVHCRWEGERELLVHDRGQNHTSSTCDG